MGPLNVFSFIQLSNFRGVKNIHLGPTLPAFLSPNVAKLLTEQFGIGGITTVDEDLKLFFC